MLGIVEIKHPKASPIKKEAMHKTFGSSFFVKDKKETINLNEQKSNENIKLWPPLEINKPENLKEFDLNNKKNKFAFQNAILQKKIHEEEKLLITKYKAKFDLNVQESKHNFIFILLMGKRFKK